jgi:PHD-finger
VRELLKNLTEMNSDGARWDTLEPDEDGQIDLEYVLCTKCGTSETTDENDLVLCDNTGCFRAYHQECLEPHVSSDVFEEDEDSDWFCWQCECIADCLEMLDDEFEGCYFEKWQVSQSFSVHFTFHFELLRIVLMT